MRTSLVLVLVLLLLEYPLLQPSNLRIPFFPAKKIRDKPPPLNRHHLLARATSTTRGYVIIPNIVLSSTIAVAIIKPHPKYFALFSVPLLS